MRRKTGGGREGRKMEGLIVSSMVFRERGGQVPTKGAKVINCLLSVLRRMQVFAKCVQSSLCFTTRSGR